MEAKNIFDLLNSTLWQDFKGFLRDEINKDKGTVEMPFIIRELFVWLIFLTLSPILILAMPKYLFAVLLSPFRRRRITNMAYDIEVTTSKYKLIRSQKGKYGICFWENILENKLLLKSKYDKIVRSESGNAFILEKNGLFGLYGANVQKIILDCKYTSISNLHDDIFLAKKGETECKYNSMGDRILL